MKEFIRNNKSVMIKSLMKGEKEREREADAKLDRRNKISSVSALHLINGVANKEAPVFLLCSVHDETYQSPVLQRNPGRSDFTDPTDSRLYT